MIIHLQHEKRRLSNHKQCPCRLESISYCWTGHVRWRPPEDTQVVILIPLPSGPVLWRHHSLPPTARRPAQDACAAVPRPLPHHRPPYHPQWTESPAAAMAGHYTLRHPHRSRERAVLRHAEPNAPVCLCRQRPQHRRLSREQQ